MLLDSTLTYLVISINIGNTIGTDGIAIVFVCLRKIVREREHFPDCWCTKSWSFALFAVNEDE